MFVRCMQSRLKKEWKAQHDIMESRKLKEQSKEEMEQLKERLEEEQKEAAEKSQQIIKRQRNRSRKPFLEVGEEVYGAWCLKKPQPDCPSRLPKRQRLSGWPRSSTGWNLFKMLDSTITSSWLSRSNMPWRS